MMTLEWCATGVVLEWCDYNNSTTILLHDNTHFALVAKTVQSYCNMIKVNCDYFDLNTKLLKKDVFIYTFLYMSVLFFIFLIWLTLVYTL